MDLGSVQAGIQMASMAGMRIRLAVTMTNQRKERR
jgi:hypothetical protein